MVVVMSMMVVMGGVDVANDGLVMVICHGDCFDGHNGVGDCSGDVDVDGDRIRDGVGDGEGGVDGDGDGHGSDCDGDGDVDG